MRELYKLVCMLELCLCGSNPTSPCHEHGIISSVLNEEAPISETAYRKRKRNNAGEECVQVMVVYAVDPVSAPVDPISAPWTPPGY